MGNASSSGTENNSSFFLNRYNWITSYPMNEYPYYECNKNFNLKSYIDLRLDCPPIIDIGVIPIHPIASVVSILNYQLVKNKLKIFPPSKLFIYHNCSYFEGVTNLLSFEMIFKAIEKYGFCSEIEFQYHSDNLHIKPSYKNYNDALAYKYIDIQRVKNNLNTIKSCLHEGIPLLIGFVIYTDLYKIVDKIWLPDLEKDKRLGGCSGVIVGYNDDSESFFLKMAFSENFGNSGYITIPYEYINNQDLTPEIYIINLNKNRIEGCINQSKEMIKINNIKKTEKNSIFG